jgi:hypothetical protein
MPTNESVAAEGNSLSKNPNPADKGSIDFSDFFQKYLNAWVAAAIALPTAITWKGMPMYESQRGILTTYTALSCILILAFLFYARNQLTIKLKSGVGSVGIVLLPFFLICATGFCGYKYYDLLIQSAPYTQSSLADARAKVSIEDIHDGTSILAYYILTMVFAEAALFLMAIREWRPRKP